MSEDDLRAAQDLYTSYLEHNRHIESMVLSSAKFYGTIVTVIVAACGVLLSVETQLENGWRYLFAGLLLSLATLICSLARRAIDSLGRFNGLYLERRRPLELLITEARGLHELRERLTQPEPLCDFMHGKWVPTRDDLIRAKPMFREQVSTLFLWVWRCLFGLAVFAFASVLYLLVTAETPAG